MRVVEVVAADLTEPGAAARLLGGRPDVVFHLAAVVSGEAEADLDKGYAVNLDGTRALLDAVRTAHVEDGCTPRVVFSSSIAVYGAPLPDPIPEGLQQTPLTSYGTQKAIGELLLADFTRRGFLDGIGVRLPTVCIRPGRPNQAASGFFSSILREPLVGQEAVLPVPESVRHWHASPRSAVRFLVQAADARHRAGGTAAAPSRCRDSVQRWASSSRRCGRVARGDRAVRLVRHEPDPAVMRIVETWAPRPAALDASPRRACSISQSRSRATRCPGPSSPPTPRRHRPVPGRSTAEKSFEEIIRVHVEDELGGVLPT